MNLLDFVVARWYKRHWSCDGWLCFPSNGNLDIGTFSVERLVDVSNSNVSAQDRASAARGDNADLFAFCRGNDCTRSSWSALRQQACSQLFHQSSIVDLRQDVVRPQEWCSSFSSSCLPNSPRKPCFNWTGILVQLVPIKAESWIPPTTQRERETREKKVGQGRSKRGLPAHLNKFFS